MIFLKPSFLLALISASFLVSCATDLKTLSDSEIKKGHTNIVMAAGPPSAELLAVAAKKPKDRHSMPIYKFAERNRIVRTTAYTCSEADHIKYGSKNAAGTALRYTDKVRSAAADWSFYPVGTVFRIKGHKQLYVVDDYGSALAGTGTIDLYHPNKAAMRKWGLRNVEITVVQWGSFTRSVMLLKGRTKFAHCRQMLSNIIRQRPDLERLAKR